MRRKLVTRIEAIKQIALLLRCVNNRVSPLNHRVPLLNQKHRRELSVLLLHQKLNVLPDQRLSRRKVNASAGRLNDHSRAVK